MLDKLQPLPSCATSPPTSRPGADADADHRPRPGGALRHPAALIDDTLYDAFGQRQVAQYFTQLNSYHVILE
jgi:multidrug efflux pump subunit AcrB